MTKPTREQIVDCYSCGHYSEEVSGCDPIMPKCEGHKYWVKRYRSTQRPAQIIGRVIGYIIVAAIGVLALAGILASVKLLMGVVG